MTEPAVTAAGAGGRLVVVPDGAGLDETVAAWLLAREVPRSKLLAPERQPAHAADAWRRLEELGGAGGTIERTAVRWSTVAEVVVVGGRSGRWPRWLRQRLDSVAGRVVVLARRPPTWSGEVRLRRPVALSLAASVAMEHPEWVGELGPPERLLLVQAVMERTWALLAEGTGDADREVVARFGANALAWRRVGGGLRLGLQPAQARLVRQLIRRSAGQVVRGRHLTTSRLAMPAPLADPEPVLDAFYSRIEPPDLLAVSLGSPAGTELWLRCRGPELQPGRAWAHLHPQRCHRWWILHLSETNPHRALARLGALLDQVLPLPPTVGAVMQAAPATGDTTLTVAGARERVHRFNLGALVIIDRPSGRVEGIVERADLDRALGLDLGDLPVRRLLLGGSPAVCSPRTPLPVAVERLLAAQQPLLPVVDGQRVVGMVGARDLLAAAHSLGSLAGGERLVDQAESGGWAGPSEPTRTMRGVPRCRHGLPQEWRAGARRDDAQVPARRRETPVSRGATGPSCQGDIGWAGRGPRPVVSRGSGPAAQPPTVARAGRAGGGAPVGGVPNDVAGGRGRSRPSRARAADDSPPDPAVVAGWVRDLLPAWVGKVLLDIGRIAAAGSQPVFLVGGVVRDLILGRPTLDLDLTTLGDAVGLAERCRELLVVQPRPELLVFSRFRTARLILGGVKIDFASARREHYAEVGALPEVEAGSLQEDLGRRDFTLNAMAVRLDGEQRFSLLDPYRGLADLRRRSLRILHPLSFVEDPTRIFRAWRFRHRFGFDFHPETERAMTLAADRQAMLRLSARRMVEELRRIMREPAPHRVLIDLMRFGWLRALHPDLDDPARLPVRLNLVPGLVRRFRGLAEAVDAGRVLWIGLFSLLGSVEVVDGLMGRAGFAAEDRRIVGRGLEALHELPGRLAALLDGDDLGLYRILREVPIDALVGVLAYTELGRREVRLVLRYIERFLQLRTALRGADLIGLGIQPGPRLGKILAELLEARVSGRVSTRQEEIDHVIREHLPVRT